MAIDAFIKFTASNPKNNVQGESQDKTLNGMTEGWSSVRSITFSSEHKASIGTSSSGAGGGKVDFKEFQIKKFVDIASPALFLALCSGAHFEKVDLHLRKATGGASTSGNTAYLQYVFHMVFVTKIDTSLDAEGEAPEETVTFEYGATQLTYQKQDVDGSFKGPKVVQQWSRVTNDASTVVKA